MTLNADSSSSRNSTECDELLALIPAYALGATTDEETRRVEALLPRCPDGAAELASYKALTEGLLEGVAPVAPPPQLRQRLIDAIAVEEKDLLRTTAATPPEPKPSVTPMVVIPPVHTRPRSTIWLAAAVAAVVLLVAGVLFLRPGQPGLPDEQRIAMLDQGGSGTEVAAVYWNPDDGTARMVTEQMPALAANQTYQLWVIGEEGPVSVGLFEPDESGRAELTFTPEHDLPDYDAVGITVEPAGGSPAPTSAPIVVGTV